MSDTYLKIRLPYSHISEVAFRVVDRVDVPVITQDVGKELGVDWHTAEKRLQKLIEKNRIKRTTVSGWHLHTAACSR